MTSIKVWSKNTKSFQPLVKNSRGLWQIVEHVLKAGDKIYAYFNSNGWCLGLIQYCRKSNEFYFISPTSNKYTDLNEELEIRTVAEQEKYIRQANDPEEQEEAFYEKIRNI
jgi:hypothetical protein